MDSHADISTVPPMEVLENDSAEPIEAVKNREDVQNSEHITTNEPSELAENVRQEPSEERVPHETSQENPDAHILDAESGTENSLQLTKTFSESESSSAREAINSQILEKELSLPPSLQVTHADDNTTESGQANQTENQNETQLGQMALAAKQMEAAIAADSERAGGEGEGEGEGQPPIDHVQMVEQQKQIVAQLTSAATNLREFVDLKLKEEYVDESEREKDKVERERLHEEFFSSLHSFLTFGLKRKLCQSVMDIAAQRHQHNTPIAVLTVKEFSPVLWDYLKETLDATEVDLISSLPQVHTDFGRGRAWVCHVLNTKQLAHFYQNAFQGKALLERYYEEFSCVRENEVANSVVTQMADTVSNVPFHFTVNSSQHDTPKLLQGEQESEKVWHYEIHAPWPNEQNHTSTQFLEQSSTDDEQCVQDQQSSSSQTSGDNSFPNPGGASSLDHETENQTYQSQDNATMEHEFQAQQHIMSHGQTFTELSNFDPNDLNSMTPGSHAAHSNHYYEGMPDPMTPQHESIIDRSSHVMHSDSPFNDLINSPDKNLMTSEAHLQQNASVTYQNQLSSNHISSVPGTAIYGNHQAHYVPQYHSMQMQPPQATYHDPMGLYQPRPHQMLPKIEELMAPPNSRNQQQEFPGSNHHVMYSAAPHGTDFYMGPMSQPHYEPISPAMADGNMPVYSTIQPPSLPPVVGSPGDMARDNLDLDSLSGSPLPPKTFCPEQVGPQTQLKVMPNNRAEHAKMSRMGLKRTHSTGRGRGRPRQRPKIQGLPPPMDKEEAKEQTATFHRVYERVRRTEIKKGYDILENLIPFHLRSDILGKKKHFSTTDVLNCARDYIEELKSDQVQHQIVISQMQTESDTWKARLRKLTLEAIKRNKVLLSNESLPEFETMDYKTSLSRFIPHVCLPNIGIQTGVFQELPAENSPDDSGTDYAPGSVGGKESPIGSVKISSDVNLTDGPINSDPVATLVNDIKDTSEVGLNTENMSAVSELNSCNGSPPEAAAVYN